ncbi:MAG: ribonuclease HII [Oligoflexia bacterium]|nr:ribonuclease HII [Oligoflexia bacterium]
MSKKSKEEFIYIGADEVGRGPLAGPVVGAGCLFLGSDEEFKTLSSDLRNLGICDSKKLSQKKRLEILESFNINIKKVKNKKNYLVTINNFNLHLTLNELSPSYIDEHNILVSSLTAMNETITNFKKIKTIDWSLENKRICFDGNKIPKNKKRGWDYLSLVKGDSKCPFIGLASIFAKEYRDYLMLCLGEKYPGYGLEKHAGYPTRFHKEAISKLGVTNVHRKSFKGVKEHIQ